MGNKMSKISSYISHLFSATIIFTVANTVSFSSLFGTSAYLWVTIPLSLFINIFPSIHNRILKSARLRNCADGCELLRLFLLTTAVSIIYSIVGWVGKLSVGDVSLGNFKKEPIFWLNGLFVLYVVELIIFWNGMIRIYLTSVQLGIRFRVIGALCGMIPIVHLIVLGIMIHTVEAEVRTENEKLLLNEARKTEQICQTKYPLLMVHGVFFRDFRYFNYWGRVPAELQKNGATVFYGNHESASCVADSAQELTERIREIVRTTGCEKVNIIAHSKGGLDCRYAISMLDAAPYVAGTTTINTPHRGCEFADYLLSGIPEKQKKMVARTYNSTLRKFGDKNPDFLAAVSDLTASSCKKFNEKVQDTEGVYYQSVGSKLNRAMSGRFPLNFSYQLVNYFDGNNDGLVGEKSFPWGGSSRF